MLVRRFLLLSLLLQSSFAHARSFSPHMDFGPRDRELLPFSTQERPFKLGSWAVSPRADREKPLASTISPGMAFGQGVAVLAYDQEWVGGFSFKDKRNLWWYKANGGLTAPPTIFGESVILGFRDGSVHKVNLLTGSKEWDT